MDLPYFRSFGKLTDGKSSFGGLTDEQILVSGIVFLRMIIEGDQIHPLFYRGLGALLVSPSVNLPNSHSAD